MPATIPPHSESWRTRNPRGATRLRLAVAILAAGFGFETVLAGGMLAAQSPAGPPASAAEQKPPGSRANTRPIARGELHQARIPARAQAAAQNQAAQPAPPAPPPAPKAPDWPVNSQPTPATVVWDSQGLRISADNSSLDQILHQVAQETGSKVEGLSQDQRVFGSYGPGEPRDVLSQLLEGSGYNVLMLGGQGDGAPEEIVLSIAKPAGPQPVASNASDDAEGQVEEPPEPLPEPRPEPVRSGFAPGQPPNTPQQLWQDMRERQLQMQREQQNNTPPEQQNSPPN